MMYEVYSVFDRVLGLYQDPFLSLNVGSAVRRFKAMCKNNFVAPDLVLYHIASFDSSTGRVTPLENADPVLQGSLNFEDIG